MQKRRTSDYSRNQSNSRWGIRALSTTEYALIVAGVAIVASGTFFLLGGTLTGSFSKVNEGLEGMPQATAITPTAVITQTGTPTITVPISSTAAATEQRPLEGTATPAAPVATTIPREPDYFFDNFDDGSADNWVVTSGSEWVVDDGQYCNYLYRSVERRTFVGDPNWTDYTVSLRANLIQGNGWGLYFRATNLNLLDAYVFQYDPGFGAFIFRQVIDGHEQSPFGRANVPSDYEWRDTWHTIRLIVQGNTFTAFVDDAQVLQASNSDYPAGQVGLRLWSTSTACFDDFTVTPLGP
jgi:Flp pilus assembly pilin Flp